MSGLLAIPVSAMEPRWIHTAFKPQLQCAINNVAPGGIVWLIVDAKAEGNYLLNVARDFVAAWGLSAKQLTVHPEDPFLVWEDLFGAPDRLPSSSMWSDGSLVTVENGTELPVRFLQERISVLATYCRSREWTLLIPVLHDARPHFQIEGNRTSELSVPRFGSVGDRRQRDVVQAMVRAEFPSLDPEQATSLVQQLLGTDPPPTSRTEVQEWVDFYFRRPDVVSALRDNPPPPLPRHYRLPVEVPTADDLRSKLSVLEATFRKAGDKFSAWRGRPLFEIVQALPDPFRASDPMHWFSATVSYLSCIRESADQSLKPLSGYEYHEDDDDLKTSGVPEFYDVLRALRTTMQHGLSPARPKDRKTLETAQRWYHRHCGSVNPERHHWRQLTRCLIEEAWSAADRLATCVIRAPGCKSRAVVESQLQIHARSLSTEQWRMEIRTSIERRDAKLDPDRVMDKHLNGLQNSLRESVVTTDEVLAAARKLIDEVIAREVAR